VSTLYVDDQVYAFPNKISRILLMAMREVMGKNGISAVLHTAHLQHLVDYLPPPNFDPGLTFSEVGQLFQATEGIYGVRGGRRVGRQIGHVCFKYGIDGFGGVIGFADFALRFLPISLRVHVGLEILAEIFNRYSDQKIVLDENGDSYLFIMERSGFCWNRHANTPTCSLMVGLLEETLYWVSRGTRFWVEETECIACGHLACTIQISKNILN